MPHDKELDHWDATPQDLFTDIMFWGLVGGLWQGFKGLVVWGFLAALVLGGLLFLTLLVIVLVVYLG